MTCDKLPECFGALRRFLNQRPNAAFALPDYRLLLLPIGPKHKRNQRAGLVRKSCRKAVTQTLYVLVDVTPLHIHELIVAVMKGENFAR
jgi:hypothetical protein